MVISIWQLLKLVLNLHFAKIAKSESKSKMIFDFAERKGVLCTQYKIAKSESKSKMIFDFAEPHVYLCTQYKNSKIIDLLNTIDVII